MNIEPIAFFRSPLTSKFGIPRQSGLAPALAGRIVFVPDCRHAEAVRGLDAFDYLWLIWEFSQNAKRSTLNSQLSTLNYTIPCASMALATFMKPATFAPLT